MAKAKKKRADKYDSKPAINGNFDNALKVPVTPVKPTLFADFQNADKLGRVRFTNGTLADIKRLNIVLKEDLEIILDDGEEFMANGVIVFSKEEDRWVMKYDKMIRK